jgi:hypothetical protein
MFFLVSPCSSVSVNGLLTAVVLLYQVLTFISIRRIVRLPWQRAGVLMGSEFEFW